jgi:hypothetical protein
VLRFGSCRRVRLSSALDTQTRTGMEHGCIIMCILRETEQDAGPSPFMVEQV